MSENKTRPSSRSAEDYLDSVSDPVRREDARSLCEMMKRITGEEPVLWGGSMIGFGKYCYRYESGREGEWLATGLAPRAKELAVYLIADASGRQELLARLGKHRTGKSCLHIKRLSDVDLDVLEELVVSSLAALRERHPDA